MNSRYGFEAARQNDAWVLTRVIAPEPADHKTYGGPTAHCGFDGLGSSFHGALADPGTKLVRGGPSVWRGKPCRELVVDTTIIGTDRGRYRRRYGLYAAADGPATILGYRLYRDDDPVGWYTENVIETAPGPAGRPQVKAVEVYAADKTAKYEPWIAQRWDLTRSEPLPGPVPEREFTLSAFGLPEPTTIPKSDGPAFEGPRGDPGLISRQPDPPAEPWRPWWLLALVVGLLAAAGVWAVRRRAG
jgi:hypothetical protein